jgi:hypothetical protein
LVVGAGLLRSTLATGNLYKPLLLPGSFSFAFSGYFSSMQLLKGKVLSVS